MRGFAGWPRRCWRPTGSTWSVRRGDGETALAEAARLRPALVLLDVQLPDLDGFEVAARLASLADPPAVVLISSRAASSYRRRLPGARLHRQGRAVGHGTHGIRRVSHALGPVRVLASRVRVRDLGGVGRPPVSDRGHRVQPARARPSRSPCCSSTGRRSAWAPSPGVPRASPRTSPDKARWLGTPPQADRMRQRHRRSRPDCCFRGAVVRGAPPLREEVVRPQRTIKEKEKYTLPTSFNL
jgi:CheY-like chemotaxis protein